MRRWGIVVSAFYVALVLLLVLPLMSRLQGWGWSEATLTFGEADKHIRYILLYTRANLLGQSVDAGGLFSSGGSTRKGGGFEPRKFGLERTVRSLEGRIEVERKPMSSPRQLTRS